MCVLYIIVEYMRSYEYVLTLRLTLSFLLTMSRSTICSGSEGPNSTKERPVCNRESALYPFESKYGPSPKGLLKL